MLLLNTHIDTQLQANKEERSYGVAAPSLYAVLDDMLFNPASAIASQGSVCSTHQPIL
jgi:hypothetical protein